MLTKQTPLLRVEQVNLGAFVGGNPQGLSVLKDISFQVCWGDRLTIIGPSGAGKTSLLRLLNRLSEPTSGSIYLEDLDYRKIPVRQLRRQIMLVSQEPKLLGMTVRDALAYPLFLQELKPAIIQQQVDIWMEQLHIPEDWLGRTELQLSVGQRQLVAIARALVVKPKILLLDEPTSALDAGRSAHVLQVLTELANNKQMTIIMVNHQLDIAQMFSDRVLYIQDGQIVEDTQAKQMDWAKLRENLIQAEATAAQEWS